MLVAHYFVSNLQNKRVQLKLNTAPTFWLLLPKSTKNHCIYLVVDKNILQLYIKNLAPFKKVMFDVTSKKYQVTDYDFFSVLTSTASAI